MGSSQPMGSRQPCRRSPWDRRAERSRCNTCEAAPTYLNTLPVGSKSSVAPDGGRAAGARQADVGGGVSGPAVGRGAGKPSSGNCIWPDGGGGRAGATRAKSGAAFGLSQSSELKGRVSATDVMAAALERPAVSAGRASYRRVSEQLLDTRREKLPVASPASSEGVAEQLSEGVVRRMSGQILAEFGQCRPELTKVG